MKKIFVSLLAISAFAFSAGAQTPDNGAPNNSMPQHKEWNHGHRGGMDWKQLNLTQTQKDQLKAYREEYKKKLQELDKNESITVKESRDGHYALRQEQKQKFLSVLTPDQKAQLDQMKQQRQQQHEAMAAKKLDRMKVILDLTDDQVAQIKAQREEIHAKIKAIREDQNLGREDKKEKLEAIRNENKDSFKKILTPTQLNKLEELKKDRMDRRAS